MSSLEVWNVQLIKLLINILIKYNKFYILKNIFK